MTQQTTPPELLPTLRRVRRRLAVQQWLSYLLRCAFVATIAACVWLVVSRLFPQIWDAAIITGILWCVAGVAASILAWRKRPALVEASLQADQRLGLKERLTSSLALREVASPMVEAVHRDAQQHLARLDLRRDFPLAPAQSLRWFFVPFLLLGAGYVLLPEFDLFGHEERALQAKAQATKIEARATALQQAAKLLPPKADAPEVESPAAQELKAVAKALSAQEITEKQALTRVANLAHELQHQREQLKEKYNTPQVAGDPNKLNATREIAKAMQDGQYAEAAKKLRELKEKLKKGDLKPEEKAQLKEEAKQLQKMMGGSKQTNADALSKALSGLAEGLESGKESDVLAAMEAMDLSLEDLASAMEQMAKLDAAASKLGEWKQGVLGPSKFCRSCGKKLSPCKNPGQCKGTCKGGQCAGECSGGTCSGNGTGPGMGGAGRGQGNQVGELPDEQVAYTPTILPGGMEQGKMLANMLQRTAPEDAPESAVELLPGAFEAVKQEAEQALTQEEIPRGSKEFVRQYFGTLESETAGQ